MAFCTNCGSSISDMAVACPHCGQRRDPGSVAVRSGERQDGYAVASLALGVASFLLPGPGIVTAILAIVFGKRAKRNIASDPGLGGRGLAKAGIILGWIWVALAAVAVSIGVLVIASGRLHFE